MTKVEDPVCGMMVNPDDAEAKSTWAGKTWYFCSTECKRKFDADPEQYVAGNRHEPMVNPSRH